MVQNDEPNISVPKSWGDVRMVVLGDSQVGSLSFKAIAADERPKLRARSFKGIRLHQLLPMVESEITEHHPHLIVMSVGFSDLTHFTCQYFPETTHQHRVRSICYDFSIKLAADEIFRQWHSWLAKFSCKVLIALTYPMDFQEFNFRKLKHCPECQDAYNDGGLRDVLCERIKEWGDLLTEKEVPVMFLDDVLKRINPDYMETDSVIAEEERAIIDGVKLNSSFAKEFYAVIKETVEKVWPNFIGGEEVSAQEVVPDSPPPSPSGSQESSEDVEENAVQLPPKKKTKHMFRF